MEERTMWRTWKPYAVLAVLAIGGIWWWNAQSPFATLQDGSYSCTGVYVNEDSKYEILVDSAGQRYSGTARVEGGELVELAGATPLTTTQISRLMLKSTGTTKFHVTDDPATKMYNAIACELAG
ncbi:hypothetical protein JOF42_000791 [Microbacterium phyllosphaerae]|uniref:Uncharacterized protein n=1 Tax=Microbacterium phyllosphaerae TaxID=124798 RepID=A0ABS4WM76_9MICO|nr:hypothetical protein [Microbacterium phyllosphaerae]MBP2377296.1 hypothetical protein [Microbacterium phyllosphaerae]